MIIEERLKTAPGERLETGQGDRDAFQEKDEEGELFNDILF